MDLSYPLVGALGGTSSLRVLGPDNPGRVSVSRAGLATFPSPAADLTMAAANTARLSGTTHRLIVEGARGNMLRNPRGEGGAAGVAPQYWSLSSQAAITAMGMEGAMPYADVNFAHTAATGQTVTFDTNAFMAGTQGGVFTFSLYVRRISGSLTGFSTFRLRFREATSTGAFLADQWKDIPLTSITEGALGGGRLSFTTTLSQTTTAGFTVGIRLDSTSTANMSLRIGVPQVEQAAFASSPILPAAGTPAVSTREADAPFWAPSGGFGSRGTVVVKAMLPQSAPFGASQGLWQIDDGTDQNRIQLRNTSAGSAITGVVDIGGTTYATLSAGNMSAGTPFRAAFTWAEGDQALCLGGGTVQKATASLPPGLTRMLLGHGSSQLNRAAFGEVELVDYRPNRVSDGLLQALANAA